MNNTMTYKGLTARVEFSADDSLFVGRLIGVEDVVGFHANTVEGLRAAFEEAVDDYLATCERLGRGPLKSASGQMMLRVPTEVHAAALRAAEGAGKSLNQWAAEVFSKAARG
jgi:predicted HicB family RNase H-like nuclease